ncbi:hypothetical protein HTZ85_20680 [Escherichia coli]|nr:hypothetical protein [Escherichia coli]
MAMLLLIKAVFAGTIEGAGQLTIGQNGSYVLSGAQSMAPTGDIVVDDGAVLSLEGDAADLTALRGRSAVDRVKRRCARSL